MGADTRIQSKLQSFGMNVVGHIFHTVRESFGIAHDVAIGIAVHLPAVVDDDIFITGVFHT